MSTQKRTSVPEYIQRFLGNNKTGKKEIIEEPLKDISDDWNTKAMMFQLEREDNYLRKKTNYKIKGIQSGEEVERVPKDKLELVYRREALVTNGINLYEELISAANIIIDTDNDKARKIILEMFEDMNFSGYILPQMIKHQAVYGTSWNEIVWNEAEDRIVMLDTMDPKYMDYARDNGTRNLVFDGSGQPAHYIQYLRWDQKAPNTAEVKEQVGNKGIVFNRKEVLRMNYQTMGDSFSGIGLIEPIYNTIINKIDMQTGLAQSTLRLGFPIIGVKVGSQEVYPTPQLMEKGTEIFQNINESSGFSIPYYFEPIILEPKRSERVQQNLGYFTDQMIAGLGVPKPLITGAGEQENKQTLEGQKEIFMLKVKSWEKKIARGIEVQVFSQLAERLGWDEIPKMRFSNPTEDILGDSSTRFCEYVKAGILLPEEVKSRVMKNEGLIPETEDE